MAYKMFFLGVRLSDVDALLNFDDIGRAYLGPRAGSHRRHKALMKIVPDVRLLEIWVYSRKRGRHKRPPAHRHRMPCRRPTRQPAEPVPRSAPASAPAKARLRFGPVRHLQPALYPRPRPS